MFTPHPLKIIRIVLTAEFSNPENLEWRAGKLAHQLSDGSLLVAPEHCPPFVQIVARQYPANVTEEHGSKSGILFILEPQ